MKKKTIWLTLSSLVTIAMLLVSCGKAETTTTPTTTPMTTPNTQTTTTAPVTTSTTALTTTPATTIEKPQYGGSLSISRPVFAYIDPYRYEHSSCAVMTCVNDKLAVGDWAVDRKKFAFPAATTSFVPLNYLRGALAESWEIPDPQTFIVHLRQGVHFQNKPPTNGREFTADDVVWNYQRYLRSPFVDQMYIGAINSVTALNKNTVEMKLKAPPSDVLIMGILDTTSVQMIAKESVGASGQIEDWKNVGGTGPFMLIDYVPDSSLSFVKNPTYWAYDERYPNNRLPYVDTYRVYVIADVSTQLAAIRTGKIDQVQDIFWKDAESAKSTRTDLLVFGQPTSSRIFKMRNDTKPFTDVRVRQALNMAINLEELTKSYFGGNAIIYASALQPLHGSDFYTPFDELPDKPMWTKYSVKEVLTYNPQKAKALLAEAGYPDGFKTNIITCTTMEPELAVILQGYLAAIGVKAELRIMEKAAFDVLRYGLKHDQIILHWHSQYADPLQLFQQWTDPKHQFNSSVTNDPVFNEICSRAVDVQNKGDYANLVKLARELEYYSLENAFYIVYPAPLRMTVWQPWVKGYAGEGNLGAWQMGQLFARLWVDRDLKKSKGY